MCVCVCVCVCVCARVCVCVCVWRGVMMRVMVTRVVLATGEDGDATMGMSATGIVSKFAGRAYTAVTPIARERRR
jgi:hypothetical protein